MLFLVLILAVVPTYATGEYDHALDKRQVHQQAQQLNYRPYSQAPAQIKQLLQAQQHRDPIVHLPAQQPPRLGPAGHNQAGQAQRQSQHQAQHQGQVSQYRPQVQYASAPQQPTYKNLPAARPQYRQPVAPQQPLYRPAPAANYPQQAAHANYRGYNPVPASQAQQPHYSSKLPPQLQQLLQLQANLANTIPSGRPAQQSKVY